jgi:hypothetical protein
MHPVLRKKFTLVLLLILCTLAGIFCVQAYMGMARQKRAKAVAAEFGAALQRLHQSPPGAERVETFLSKMRAIDTSYAASDLRQSLQSYIAAVQQSLDATKAGRDIRPYDAAIVRAKRRLTDSVQEYD